MSVTPWILADHERVVYDVPVTAADAALAALRRAGIPARTFGSAAGSLELSHRTHGLRNTAHVGIAVHVDDADEARGVLEGWEGESKDRVRGHLRRLPGDLLRLALLVGGAITVAVLASNCFDRGEVVAGLATIGVAVVVLFSWIRIRGSRGTRSRGP